VSGAKVAIWVAVIGALGLILAAVIGLFAHSANGPSNRIDQTNNGGTNVACQDHAICANSK
jgi:hypothetical protein